MYSKHQKLLSMQCQLQQCPFSDFVCSVEFLYYLHFRYLFRLPISIMRPFFMFNDNLHVQCVNQSISLTTFSLTSTHIRYTVIYLFLVCCFTFRQFFFSILWPPFRLLFTITRAYNIGLWLSRAT